MGSFDEAVWIHWVYFNPSKNGPEEVVNLIIEIESFLAE